MDAPVLGNNMAEADGGEDSHDHSTPDCEAHSDDDAADEETGEGSSDCDDSDTEDAATTEPDEGVCAGGRGFEAVALNQ